MCNEVHVHSLSTQTDMNKMWFQQHKLARHLGKEGDSLQDNGTIVETTIKGSMRVKRDFSYTTIRASGKLTSQ
jgi:hypothetical protein